jgi:hypothetical protein
LSGHLARAEFSAPTGPEALLILSVRGSEVAKVHAARSWMMVVVAGGLLVSCGGSSTEVQSTSAGSDPAISSAPAATTTNTANSASVATSTSTSSPEERVTADFLVALSVRERCDYEPMSCDYSAIAVPESAMDRVTRDTIKMHIGGNLRAVPGNGDVRTRVESVSIVGDAAFVVSCIYDTEILFDVGRSPKAFDDIVFNDFKQSDRVRWELRQQEGRWLITQGEQLQSLTGGDLCGF